MKLLYVRLIGGSIFFCALSLLLSVGIFYIFPLYSIFTGIPNSYFKIDWSSTNFHLSYLFLMADILIILQVSMFFVVVAHHSFIFPYKPEEKPLNAYGRALRLLPLVMCLLGSTALMIPVMKSLWSWSENVRVLWKWFWIFVSAQLILLICLFSLIFGGGDASWLSSLCPYYIHDTKKWDNSKA